MADYSWCISFMMSKPERQSKLVEVQEQIMVSRLKYQFKHLLEATSVRLAG